MAKATTLYDCHVTAGGKLVDFHGWDLPVHYGSQLKEHEIVRQDAGMFDVSHMAVVDLLGAGGRQVLRYLLANDIDKLQVGKSLYSCMLNQHGGIIDDLICTQRGPDAYRLVLNAAKREQDLKWIREQVGNVVGIQEHVDLAMIAVQGPNAFAKTCEALTPEQADAITQLKPFESVDIGDTMISRTGYTGEDGLEIITPQTEVVALWQRLLQQEVTPCGLGARDTLRLEAGFLLSGQDMDETTTPLESGLGWTVAFAPDDRDFIGRGALQSQKSAGTKRKLVGLILQGKGIMRHGQTLHFESGETGSITSGSYAPTLQQSIALARIPKSDASECLVEIRNKRIPAKIVKPRFVKQGKSLVL